MKSLVVAAIAFLALSLMSSISDAQIVSTQRAIKFMKSQRPCDAWWVGALVASTSGTTADKAEYVTGSATCIFYGSTNPNSVHGHVGCIVARYDLDEGTYDLGPMPLMIEDKQCTPEIVAKLLVHPRMGRPLCGNRHLLVGGIAKLMPLLRKNFTGCGVFV